MHEGHTLRAANLFADRRPGQLGQVLDDPAPAEPAAVLHPLQVDELDVERARRPLLDEEVAAVEVAVVVACLMKAPRHGGNSAQERAAIGIPPDSLLDKLGKPLGQEMIQGRVTGQFLRQDERLQPSILMQLLAVGDQPHHGDAVGIESPDVAGFDATGGLLGAQAQARPQERLPGADVVFLEKGPAGSPVGSVQFQPPVFAVLQSPQAAAGREIHDGPKAVEPRGVQGRAVAAIQPHRPVAGRVQAGTGRVRPRRRLFRANHEHPFS